MEDKLRAVEHAYTSLFAHAKATPYGMRYDDPALPDMYSHNFFRIDNGKLKFFAGIYEEERQYRRAHKQTKLWIEAFDYGPADLPADTARLTVRAELVRHLVMVARIDDLTPPSRTDLRLVCADVDDDFASAKIVDIASFPPDLQDFASRRFARKLPVYRDDQSGFYLFVAFVDEVPIGKCDLLIHDEIAKVEDVDVIEPYRGKGFGGEMIAQTARAAAEMGAQRLMLQVDEVNPAARLYRRLGFREVGTNLVFNCDVRSSPE